jgi:ribonuclease P protein component
MKVNEKNVSTEQSSPQTYARLSQTHEHNSRPRRAQTASRQRTQTADRHDSSQTSAALNFRAATYAFPKTARLLARREFLLLQKQGKRRHSPHFVVVTIPAQTKRPRLGITTSRRFGKAVIRNRMKRILREFFRTHQSLITPSQDIIIIPRAGAEQLTLAQVTEELGSLLFLARTST